MNSGFTVTREVYCIESGRSYVVINAEFSGKKEPYTDADIYFGRESIFFGAKSPEMDEYILTAKKRLEKIIRGKKAGGECTKREEELLAELLRRIEK